MKLTATNLDFSNLLQLSGIVKGSNPTVQLENLNAYLFYDKQKNLLSFLVKGRILTAAIGIPAILDVDSDTDIAIAIYSDNLIHLISTYSEEQKKTLIMTIEADEDTSYLEFICEKDKILFAHLISKEAEVKEIGMLIDKLETVADSKSLFSTNMLLGEDKQYFLTGIENCLSFIEGDLRNNAIAIYQDRLIANDKRHIYLYDFVNKLPINDPPLALHKEVAQVIINLNTKKGKMIFFLLDNNKVHLYDEKLKFYAELNNSMSNILPPTAEDLKMLAPTDLVFSYGKKALEEQLKFFMGFYTNKVGYKTICLDTLPEGIKFVLRNSGVVGYSSSHIERTLDVEINPQYTDLHAVVIITSIMDFIHGLAADDKVEFYLDNEHRAVVLKCNRQQIYLPKSQEK
jgi:hypothetical protein